MIAEGNAIPQMKKVHVEKPSDGRGLCLRVLNSRTIYYPIVSWKGRNKYEVTLGFRVHFRTVSPILLPEINGTHPYRCHTQL